MGKKGPMPNFKTIDDYINNQPKAAQSILQELRSIIREEVPEAIEIPDTKVPSFTLVPDPTTKLQIMIASYAKFVSFYPFSGVIDEFAHELKGYEIGKGSVKFPFNTPLPKNLIIQMVKFRKDEILKTQK